MPARRPRTDVITHTSASAKESAFDHAAAEIIAKPTIATVQVNIATGTVTYLHQDRIGSTRMITDATGAVVGTASYDSYGVPIASTGIVTSPFGYAGEYTDASGLIYLRARYYDPATAQFLTIDPALATTHQPYLYVGGDPINFTDPSGLDNCGHASGIGSFFGGIVDCVAQAGQAGGVVYHKTVGDHWRGLAQVGVGVAAAAGTAVCVASVVCGAGASIRTQPESRAGISRSGHR